LKRLKLHQFFHGVARTFSYQQAGCRRQDLKISAKIAFFLVSSGKKQISPLLTPLEKLLEKSTSSPWKKCSRRPCTQAGKMTPFL